MININYLSLIYNIFKNFKNKYYFILLYIIKNLDI